MPIPDPLPATQVASSPDIPATSGMGMCNDSGDLIPSVVAKGQVVFC